VSDQQRSLADLFAEAVARGMHAPFGLDCGYWGRKYAEKAEGVVVLAADYRRAVEALDEAIKAARMFNRSGMTWMEYDRLLVRLEGVVTHARGQS
jgi:hypothetical protein